MKEALELQDCLDTVVEKHPGGTLQVRVVGSIVEYLFSPDDPEVVVERMATEATRIVSLTITEGGYVADANDPDVAHDLESGEAPRTAFGLIVEAVHRRRGRVSRRRARRQRTDPDAFLEDRELFGDLVDDERFAGWTGRR